MNPPKARVLVVDDEKYICKIVVESLAPEDYDIVSFTNPHDAITHLKNTPVDLVLTDLVMGDLDGVQVMQTAREYHQDVVVVLMTAHPTIQTAISVLKQGAYDFLVKPFKLDLLRATIQRGLAHQQVLRDNLNLRSQVEFLKVANAVGSGLDLDKHLQLVLTSCKAELDAAGASVVEIDPETREVQRWLHDCDDESLISDVVDETLLLHFEHTSSHKPAIRTETIEINDQPMVKTLVSQPVFMRNRLCGCINVVMIDRFEHLTRGQLDVLSILANSSASAIANNKLYNDLQQSYMQAIRALANSIEARDAYTAGHTDRVSRMAMQVAQKMGWDERRLHDLQMGCMLHDIGKIGVPDAVLNKQGRLTDMEREKMLNHPIVGLKIVHGIDLLKPAIPYIGSHHERYDGLGYPRGLSGEEIPIEGRLLAVVDTFDAILSDRPYRRGAPLHVAVKELVCNRGTQFDPQIVDIFMAVLREELVDLEQLYGLSYSGTEVDQAVRDSRGAEKETKKARV